VSRLRLCLLVVPALLLAPPAHADPPPLPNPRPVIPEVRSMTVATDHAYAGDRPMLATVSPNGDGYRDLVRIRFYVTAPAQVTVRAQAAARNFQRVAQPAWFVRRKVKRGWQEVAWRPAAGLEPTTYVMLITLAWGKNVLQYGRLARDSTNTQSPIVRVLAADATLDKPSYVPGDTAQLTVANDAGALALHVLDVAATETQPTANHIEAPDLVPPVRVEWDTHRDAPATVPLAIGDWKPGVYFVAVVSDVGDVGYVPLIVRASKPTDRVAVLIPDHTWYAYDFFDDNRDGFPDSWYYRQGNDVVSLARPFAHSGVPWQFNSQMWPFLRWA
jgi:N,N-dimethylformamidase beta subunit-like protein